MKFYPLSLKKKPQNELVKELFDKGIDMVIDVRRSPINIRNSAKYYVSDPFSTFLYSLSIGYLHLPLFSNKKRLDDPKEFFTSDIMAGLSCLVLPENNYGFVCYCTEEQQKEHKCHAVWIIQYLKDRHYPDAEVII